MTTKIESFPLKEPVHILNIMSSQFADKRTKKNFQVFKNLNSNVMPFKFESSISQTLIQRKRQQNCSHVAFFPLPAVQRLNVLFISFLYSIIIPLRSNAGCH